MPASSPILGARRPAALCATALLWTIPHGVAAQEGCAMGEGSVQFVQETLPGGATIFYFTAPHFECEDDVEIWADSAVAYSELGMSHLMGSVRYIDRTRELRADTARYFPDQGRMQANGNVIIRDESDGSQIEHGELVYLRQTDFRDVETMTVTTGVDGVRPRALIVPAVADSAPPDAAPGEPYTVVSDRIFLRGDSHFTAAGTVEIEQDSLLAFADSAEYDQEGGDLLLDGSARVVSRETELLGRRITVSGQGADTSRIRATSAAQLTGDGIFLTAPEIVVFLLDGAVERLVAMPMALGPDVETDSADLAQPLAILDDAELTGDSIEILAPGEIVERVVAIGGARSESMARDSLNSADVPEVARTDWLEGDTVVVTLRPAGARVPAAATDSSEAAPPAADPPTEPPAAPPNDPPGGPPTDPPGDPAAVPPAESPAEVDAPGPAAGVRGANEVESVVAKGGARALYRLAASDSMSRVGVDPPALHYVVGSEITITMVDGDVERMRVVGQTQGIHLEPLARRPEADSVADSSAVVIDTTTTRPDTTRAPIGRVSPRPLVRRPHPSTRPPLSRKEEPWRRE